MGGVQFWKKKLEEKDFFPCSTVNLFKYMYSDVKYDMIKTFNAVKTSLTTNFFTGQFKYSDFFLLALTYPKLTVPERSFEAPEASSSLPLPPSLTPSPHCFENWAIYLVPQPSEGGGRGEAVEGGEGEQRGIADHFPHNPLLTSSIEEATRASLFFFFIYRLRQPQFFLHLGE